MRCICLLTAAVLAGFWSASAAQADSPLSAPISISITPPPADDTQTNSASDAEPRTPDRRIHTRACLEFLKFFL